MQDAIGSRTRLEILRLVAESDPPVGAERLTARLAERGVEITVDGVRYHLQMLDKRGFTTRISNRGRILTDSGWEAIGKHAVDFGLDYALMRSESLTHQVTYDIGSRCGQVVAALTVFPADQISKVLRRANRACRVGLCVSDRFAVLGERDRFGGYVIPKGSAGIVSVSSITVPGLLLSWGIASKETYGGIVEVMSWQPFKFVHWVENGRSSSAAGEMLVPNRTTRVQGIIDRGKGRLYADIHEIVGVARDRALVALRAIKNAGIGGILAIGQVGQPLLGLPVQPHTFGLVLLGGVNSSLPAYEAGVEAEFLMSAGTVDYEQLKPIGSLILPPDDDVVPPGRLMSAV